MSAITVHLQNYRTSQRNMCFLTSLHLMACIRSFKLPNRTVCVSFYHTNVQNTSVSKLNLEAFTEQSHLKVSVFFCRASLAVSLEILMLLFSSFSEHLHR